MGDAVKKTISLPPELAREAEEIARAACFLISSEASFITGEVMHVNGGSNFG